MAQRLKTDWILFLTVLTLVCFGLVMVYSSSSLVAELKFHVSSTHFFLRQLGWALFSIVLLLYCMKRDYRQWNNPRFAFAALGLVLLLLLAVYVMDSGSHRWLKAGPFSLQPSELAKPALALFLAFFLCRRLGAVNDRHTLGPIAVSISVIALAVAIADFGTAVVLVATTVAVIFVAGVDYRYLIVCGILASLLGLRIRRHETVPAGASHRFCRQRSQATCKDRSWWAHFAICPADSFDQRSGLSTAAGQDRGRVRRISGRRIDGE